MTRDELVTEAQAEVKKEFERRQLDAAKYLLTDVEGENRRHAEWISNVEKDLQRIAAAQSIHELNFGKSPAETYVGNIFVKR